MVEHRHVNPEVVEWFKSCSLVNLSLFNPTSKAIASVASTNIRPMSRKAIYRQPVPGNLQEEGTFSYDFSHYFLGDGKTLFAKLLICYLSDPVECTAVGCLCDGALRLGLELTKNNSELKSCFILQITFFRGENYVHLLLWMFLKKGTVQFKMPMSAFANVNVCDVM